MNPEELRQRLYAECRRSSACKMAVDYYIALLQNPCYPPEEGMTYKALKYYMEIVQRYGKPPRCDMRKLVEERLRGTSLEPYAQEAAEFAELLRERLRLTSRVAAATAAVVVAEMHGMRRIRHAVAGHFGVSYSSVAMHIKDAYKLYSYIKEKV